ncbi:MAG: class I SAM-dependent methyltransferase [Pseudomonadota bacterium]
MHEALFHYYSEFDAVAAIHRHVVPGLSPVPDLATNFLGVRIPAKIHPDILNTLTGRVEGPPNPGNWHADIAEWGAVLHAVDAAKDTFRIVELGCGWGCWLVNAGMAARRKGLSLSLIGIEGDSTHLVHADETLTLNGFTAADYALHHGVAGPKPGQALFPNPQAGTAEWGGEAVFYPDPKTLKRAQKDPNVQVLDCYPLTALAGDARIDLLHIDIQGAEVDYVEANFTDIAAQVSRVLIGTHSRAIEGRLQDIFLAQGWRLEMDRPAIAPPQNGVPIIRIDGVQMWANPAFNPTPAPGE